MLIFGGCVTHPPSCLDSARCPTSAPSLDRRPYSPPWSAAFHRPLGCQRAEKTPYGSRGAAVGGCPEGALESPADRFCLRTVYFRSRQIPPRPHGMCGRCEEGSHIPDGFCES